MKRTTLLIGVLLAPPIGLLLALPPVSATEVCREGHVISGRIAHVRDADTIDVADRPIRLQGIVAPDLSEPDGVDASVVVSLLSGSMIGPAICYLTGTRSHGRCVARCVITVDLAETMVSLGVARDCPSYSGGRYADAESFAHAMLPPGSIAESYKLPDACR